MMPWATFFLGLVVGALLVFLELRWYITMLHRKLTDLQQPRIMTADEYDEFLAGRASHDPESNRE